MELFTAEKGLIYKYFVFISLKLPFRFSSVPYSIGKVSLMDLDTKTLFFYFFEFVNYGTIKCLYVVKCALDPLKQTFIFVFFKKSLNFILLL